MPLTMKMKNEKNKSEMFYLHKTKQNHEFGNKRMILKDVMLKDSSFLFF